jgi:TonB family protein
MRERRRKLVGPGALIASVVLHATLIASGAWLLSRTFSRDQKVASVTPATTVDIGLATEGMELPPMSQHGEGARHEKRDPEPKPTAAFGGDRMPRPEIGTPGRGGTDTATDPALNLADTNDGLTLDRDPLNRLDRSQVQRLNTSDTRETLDDRRATPNPMELTFVSSGSGKLALRRDPSKQDPSLGSANGAEASTSGSDVGGPEAERGDGSEPEPGGDRPGSEKDVAARGVSTSKNGTDYRRSANVTLARPMVPRARAAVPAPERGRPNDNADSSQDVANAVASLIHASSAGGRVRSGVGGTAGPGAPASGGKDGSGSKSLPAGTGPGPFQDVGADPGVIGYFRAIERKVEPYWRNAFPNWAIAEGRGGLAILALTLRKDGSLAAVSVARASGFPEFDRNLVDAVKKAAPFGPLPARLGKGPLEFRMTFDATNPAVGRDGPGKGGRGR